MKHRYFLLAILLLSCVLIPLQKTTAKVTAEIVDSNSQTITTDSTDDVVFTVRFTSQAGDKMSIHSGILGAAGVIGDIKEILGQITVKPETLEIEKQGIHDVTITIPRSLFTTTGKYSFTYSGFAGLLFFTRFILNVIVKSPDDDTVEIDLEVVEGTIQSYTIADVQDVTWTLRVTNKSEVENLEVKLTISTAFSDNIDTTLVDLSSLSVTLGSGASKEVILTVPQKLISKINTYNIYVLATPAVGIEKDTVLTINIAPVPKVEPVFEVLGRTTQTTDITDTEDISYVLRISAGSERDRFTFQVFDGSLGWDSVLLDRYEVELDPDGYEDITLTIRRASLQEPGSYYVDVVAYSSNDSFFSSDWVSTETVVTGDLITNQPTDPIETGEPDLSMHKVVFSELMFASEGGENSLPQWIEMYNNTDAEINLRGWKLQWKRMQPSLLEVTTTFQDFIIPPQQSKLLVTALGRHSMGGDLSDAAVYQLHALHAEELGQDRIENRNRLLTRGGFSLQLLTDTDDIVDHIGTLIDDEQMWRLPDCLIDGIRSSLIRRFDGGVPRSGLERRGWSRAVDAKRLPLGLYYGDQRDRGTPGFRLGKPLPVTLSQFSARFVKDEVVINWTTESELNNAGFNILRSTSRTENFRPINPKLIQGAGTTGERNTYQFIDKTAKPDVVYYYRLEDVDLAGQRAIWTRYRIRGVIAPTGKRITTWGTLKGDR